MGVDKVKAIFFDRDGVLNKSVIVNRKPYPPKTVAEVIIPDGVKESVLELKKMGFTLIVITNQPDIARGSTTYKAVNDINDFLKTNLLLDDVYCCTHDDSDNCTCRKPKPGMIIEAEKKWNINLEKSFLIGDRWKDIQAGKNSGLKTILIDYNYNEKFIEPDYKVKNFKNIINIIKSNKT